MRSSAPTSWARRCWIALVILGLARLPVPIVDAPAPGLVAQPDASSAAQVGPESDVPGVAWQWRWATLCPGSSCPAACHSGSAPAEGDADGDECEVDVEGEYLLAGRPRGIAIPHSGRAFDAVPIVPPADHRRPAGPGVTGSFTSSFSPAIPRAALLQRWTC